MKALARSGSSRQQGRRFRISVVSIRRLLNRAFIARVIHVQVLQFIGLIALVYVATLQETHLGWWLLALGCYFLTCCLGISVTFHRALSHNTFRLPKGLEYLFSWFGAVGGSGSSVGWVAMHRKHHACADRRGDSHAIYYGAITTDPDGRVSIVRKHR